MILLEVVYIILPILKSPFKHKVLKYKEILINLTCIILLSLFFPLSNNSDE